MDSLRDELDRAEHAFVHDRAKEAKESTSIKVETGTMLADPATELTIVALRQIKAVARAVEALDDIAMLDKTCPLAAEVAMEALRDLKALVVDHA